VKVLPISFFTNKKSHGKFTGDIRHQKMTIDGQHKIHSNSEHMEEHTEMNVYFST